MTTSITRSKKTGDIVIVYPDGGYITSRTIEANLLMSILEKLEKILKAINKLKK